MQPHERLAAALERRLDELDLTWSELADAASVHEVTLRAIRRGDNQPSARTRRRLEGALSWERGSIQAILDGGEPTPLGDKSAIRDRETVEEVAADTVADLTKISEVLERALAVKRGKPLTETQRKVTAELADSLERTIEALDEETG
ncbi:helix-turn-helix transcriptional regulator [Spirillospora sp. NBC_00431]